MKVAILDDDRAWCSEAEKQMEQYCRERGIEIEVTCFFSGEELTAYNGEPFHAVFMDIELGENQANGISEAMELNQRWKGCQIVYLTNYLFYATDVYHTNHCYYVLKEQFSRRMDEVFQKLLSEGRWRELRLSFSLSGKREVVLAPEEILYFERNRRVTKIVMEDGFYETQEKLSDIEKRLPEGMFIRCHNSYIVSVSAVRMADKMNFILKDGTQIQISRRYSASSKEAFMKWAADQIL